MKSIHRLTRHMNTRTSQHFLSIYIQLKQNTPILGEEDNVSKNFGLHKDEESILEQQDIQRDHTNLVKKSSDTRSRARDNLSGLTPHKRLFTSESLSFLKKIRFSEQEFPAS